MEDPQVTMGFNTEMVEWLGWFGATPMTQETSIKIGARNRSEGHQNNHGLKNGAVLVIEKTWKNHTLHDSWKISDELDSAATDSWNKE